MMRRWQAWLAERGAEANRVDLNTITDVVRPRRRESLTEWRPGDAWLAGGTWLFSEPQIHVQRLVDLDSLAWPALEVDERGLTIAATCRSPSSTRSPRRRTGRPRRSSASAAMPC